MPISGGTTDSAVQAIMWAGALIVLALVLGIAVLLVRKWMFSDDEEGSSSDGAGLVTSLRSARDRGEISQKEYEHTLRRIRSRLTGDEPPAREASPSVAAGDGESLRAPPGMDLTGEPLPPRQD